MRNEKLDIKGFLIMFILLFLFSSCAVRNIEYDWTRLIKKKNQGYQFFLDETQINFGNTFLNELNIENIALENSKMEILISRKQKNKLESFEDLVKRGLITVPNELNDDFLVVIEGVPFSSDDKENLFFEKDVIRDIHWLDSDKMENNTWLARRAILIIELNSSKGE